MSNPYAFLMSHNSSFVPASITKWGNWTIIDNDTPSALVAEPRERLAEKYKNVKFISNGVIFVNDFDTSVDIVSVRNVDPFILISKGPIEDIDELMTYLRMTVKNLR